MLFSLSIEYTTTLVIKQLSSEDSLTTIMYGKPGKFVTQGMKEYSTNNEICQRKFLNRNFLFNNDEKTDNCCDICIP